MLYLRVARRQRVDRGQIKAEGLNVNIFGCRHFWEERFCLIVLWLCSYGWIPLIKTKRNKSAKQNHLNPVEPISFTGWILYRKLCYWYNLVLLYTFINLFLGILKRLEDVCWIKIIILLKTRKKYRNSIIILSKLR